MKFKIPFTFTDIEILKRRSKSFLKLAGKKKGKLDTLLKNCGEKIDKKQYLSICYRSFFNNLVIISAISILTMGIFSITNFLVYGLGLAIAISGFIFTSQLNYPKIFSLNKTRNIEKNLLPALQDMLVQLNSGVSVFQILSNISASDYGELSEEFKKIVAEINSGISQVEATEKYGKLNTSEYLRRVLWQISNAMRAGNDMTLVIQEEIKNLSGEQVIQIQTYGGKLNPLIMFYTLIAVIVPSLGITFVIIISSMLNLSSTMLKLLFATIFFFVILIQILFLGVIKSRRPSLL
ncbi:MAG: type II secretion system F family protein [archaeon]